MLSWDSYIYLAGAIATWVLIGLIFIERCEEKRPYLQVSFELIRGPLACVVIRNVGKCPLVITSIIFSEGFINQLDDKTRERLACLNSLQIKIFPSRYHVFSLNIITADIINKFDIKKVTIDYKYKKIGKSKKTYKEHSEIDFLQYGPMLIYISELDELKSSVDTLIKETIEIKKIIKTTKIQDATTSVIVG